MKKIAKICGIVIGALLALAIILITISAFNGGFRSVKDMAHRGELNFGNHSKIVWDHDWVWNKDWETYDLDEKSIFNSSYGIIRNEEEFQTSFSADGISNLDMELGGCKVIVEESPDAEYHVIAKRISSLQTYVAGNTLYVRGLKTGKWIKWDVSTGMMVILQIPQGVRLNEAELSFGAGIFEVEELAADECSIELGAGEVTVERLQADTLQCEVGAGRIEIENATTSRDIEFEVGAGELIYEGTLPGNLTAECGMGNMEITVLDSNEKEHNYKMECVAGNLTAGSHSVAGLAANQNINNSAASNYKLTCIMGNMEVKFR